MDAQSPTYDLVVVLNDLSLLKAAEMLVAAVQQRYGSDELLGIDLLLVESSLVGMLHFACQCFTPAISSAVLELARPAKMQVLDPMALSELEREDFYERHMRAYTFVKLGVTDIPQFFASLHDYLRLDFSPRPALEATVMERAIEVHFARPEDFLAAYLRRDAMRQQLLIPAGHEIAPGELAQLSLTIEGGYGPLRLTVRGGALDESSSSLQPLIDDRRAVDLLLPPEEYNLFEPFLMALRRNDPWPEQSGRLHERFPVRIDVQYEYDHQAFFQHAHNIGRGGLFIDTDQPPPVGTMLSLILCAPGREQPAELMAEVTHSWPSSKEGGEPIQAGMGVKFMEPAAAINEKLACLLNIPARTARHALIVDDDRFFRTVLRSELEDAGFEVLEAINVTEAFERLLEVILSLDVLVSDYYMPGGTGADLIDKVRTVGREQELAIVLLTGAQLSADEVRHISELGADDVISKGEPIDAVVARIMAVITRRMPPSTT